MGYASFSYSSDNFWLDDLNGLTAVDIPVTPLMTNLKNLKKGPASDERHRPGNS